MNVNPDQLPVAGTIQGTDRLIIQQTATSKTTVADLKAAINGGSGNNILNGLSVSVSGLNLTISPGSWQIANVIYTTVSDTHITLADPDPTDNRIDLIYGNNTGAIAVVTGVASANPVKPNLPANSIEVGFVLVTPTGASIGSSVSWGSITGTLSSQVDLQSALNLKANVSSVALKADIAATAATGTTLTFTIDKVFGTIGVPETGNVIGNVTGAQLGVTVLLIHNSGLQPIFDSKFKLLSNSGSYAINQLNYIFCIYIDATHILYLISQSL